MHSLALVGMAERCRLKLLSAYLTLVDTRPLALAAASLTYLQLHTYSQTVSAVVSPKYAHHAAPSHQEVPPVAFTIRPPHHTCDYYHATRR